MTVTTIRELLLSSAALHGPSPFLIDGADGSTRSYAEVVLNARRWAAWLRAEGLERVAIALPNSLEYAELLFGAALCGTIVCPINPALLAGEVHELMRRFGATTLLCTSSRSAELSGRSVGRKGELPAGLPPPAALDTLPVPRPDSLLSLMLSSGTSGTSKLCRITHEGAVWTSRHTAEAFGHAPGTRYLTPLPLFHINAQVIGLYAAAQAGSAIALSARMPAAQLWAAVERTQASGLSAVPAILHDLLQSPEPPPPCLKYVVTSSALLADHVRTTFEQRFNVPLRVCYGLTECTGYAAYGPGPLGSVGAARGAELRIGDEGEVLVKGRGVFPGYLDGPPVVHDGWLHTGDVGELRDGHLYLRGRIKEMINRGGEKIAPAEIEAVLTQLDGVLEAGVFAVPDERLGEELAAALVLSRDVSDDALFDHCAQALAEFRTPRKFYRLGELPKGPTGKLLRRKLREVCGA
ncbi:MAG: AMP-binding protein [Myxococcaceae bacterium]|nr:AMP-binding protein [Myxococcaceae bacterium]